MKIYTDFSYLTPNNRKNLSPLLAFHWNNLEHEAIFAGESNPASVFDLKSCPAEADWLVLPMHWTYYLWNDKANMGQAASLAEVASKHKKPLVVWYKGDLLPIVPFENTVVFLPGMIGSEAKPNQLACPAFVKDPAPAFSSDKVLYREKKDKPTVGFCGFASSNPVKNLWSIVSGAHLNIRSSLGRYDYKGVPIVPATILRNRALNRLSRSPEVESRFVIRRKYTANQVSAKIGNSSNIFFSNIYETDYTLCVRGYGNWSYRFYETLACGRIPIFIDTDCVLPLSASIDWKKYCVWIDRSERPYLIEKLLDFHSSLSSEEFTELQISCRRLWKEHLTLPGFMTHIREVLPR